MFASADWSLTENRELVVTSAVIGLLLGVLLAVFTVKAKERLLVLWDFLGTCWLGFWCWAGRVLQGYWNNDYCLWFTISAQVGFEVFLLQQWIFGYIHAVGNGGCWDQFAYWPLTATIPLFFANIFVAVGTACRLTELCDRK